MKLQTLRSYPLTPGHWAPRRSHEDASGPRFNIDEDERAEFEAKPFTHIVSLETGNDVASAHDLFTFANVTDAKAIAKVPELLHIALWAEAAFMGLAASAELVGNASDLKLCLERLRDTRAVLDEIAIER